jgi:hypothetical protein
MATTPNYGWVTPAPTDFVTDLPADFEVFADAVDADLAGLLGGTTGQVLVKNSGTDHDYDFATDPVSDKITTAGDILYGTAADTLARLGIGTAGQLLAVNSGTTAPEWITPVASVPANDTNVVTTSESTTSSTYTDLTTSGPAVTLTTGTKALIIISSYMHNATLSTQTRIAIDITGATTIAPSDANSYFLAYTSTGNTRPELQATYAYVVTGLTAGSNTFTCKYKASGGTFTARDRKLTVIDMGS